MQGVTTGALYFFFQDKEDLFASLVKEPLENLFQIIEAHYRFEREEAEGLSGETKSAGELAHVADDLGVSEQIVHFMYQNYDAFVMLLTKSQGSRFECILDEFISMSEKHYRMLMQKRAGKMEIDNYMVHWMAHMQTDIFVHMITHEPSEEQAIKHMKPIIHYLMHGWQGMFEW